MVCLEKKIDIDDPHDSHASHLYQFFSGLMETQVCHFSLIYSVQLSPVVTLGTGWPTTPETANFDVEILSYDIKFFAFESHHRTGHTFLPGAYMTPDH